MTYRTNPGSPPELKGLSTIARTFALPHEHPPMRLPSFPALERTAVMSFNSTSTYTVVASGTGSSRGLLFRQGGTPLWLEQDSSVMYALVTPLDPNAQGDTQIPKGSPYHAYTGTGGTVTTTDFSVVGGATSPTFGPIMGVDEGAGPGQWIYVPAGWNLGASVYNTLAGVSDAISIQLDQWIKPGEFSSNSSSIAFSYLGGGSTTSSYGGLQSVSFARWVRVSAISSPGGLSSNLRAVSLTLVVAPTLTLTFAATRPTYTVGASKRGMLPIPAASSYAFSTLPFRNTRVTAAAALFTNVSKVLNKEGTVQAARLNPETDNPWSFSATTFDGVHPAEKYFYGLEKGFYTYSAPSTDLATFWDYTSHYSETTYGRYYPIHRLDNNSLVNAFLFSDPDGDTSLAINLDWHIEFRNTSTLWPIGVSAVTLESLHSSQLALMEAGFFFDNVDHKWILSKITKAANYIRPVAGLHPVGRGMYKILDRMNRTSTPRPTTLQLKQRAPPPPPRGRRRRRQRRSAPPAPARTPRPGQLKSGLQMYLDSRKK